MDPDPDSLEMLDSDPDPDSMNPKSTTLLFCLASLKRIEEINGKVIPYFLFCLQLKHAEASRLVMEPVTATVLPVYPPKVICDLKPL